ncbi:hypothetical protein AB0K09_03610 [Streptomyces sp. NPDC049577]|uniref:hypothetical protein n=1 Tax=Streptomyces sp. NPDC049577 TaxID=3155153 RepID=UPI003426EF75
MAVANAYVSHCGAFPLPSVIESIREQAAQLLGYGWPLAHVVKLAAELPKWGKDLLVHAEHNPPPATAAAPHGPSRADLIAACTVCDEYGQYERPDGRIAICKHPQVKLTAVPAA